MRRLTLRMSATSRAVSISSLAFNDHFRVRTRFGDSPRTTLVASRM